MIKRAFDFVASFSGLVLISPFLILVWLWIRIFDRGPALFVQERIGFEGRPFRMYKFRTMRPSTGGPEITVGGDSRITSIGRLLRKTKLDELPQLVNVLKGDMSFVGPRPEVAKYVRHYSEAERAVLGLKPGITDPASLAMFDESEVLAGQSDPESYYINVLMREKIRVNLEYHAKSGLFSDLLIIVATVLRPLGLAPDVFRLLELKRIGPAQQ